MKVRPTMRVENVWFVSISEIIFSADVVHKFQCEPFFAKHCAWMLGMHGVTQMTLSHFFLQKLGVKFEQLAFGQEFYHDHPRIMDTQHSAYSTMKLVPFHFGGLFTAAMVFL